MQVVMDKREAIYADNTRSEGGITNPISIEWIPIFFMDKKVHSASGREFWYLFCQKILMKYSTGVDVK